MDPMLRFLLALRAQPLSAWGSGAGWPSLELVEFPFLGQGKKARGLERKGLLKKQECVPSLLAGPQH